MNETPQLDPESPPADVIYLLGADAVPKWALVPVPDAYAETSFTGTLFRVLDWTEGQRCWEESGSIFLKWDGCCHVGFCDPDMRQWQHVCGPEAMEDVLLAMRWMWREAQKRIGMYDDSQRLSELPPATASSPTVPPPG